MKNLIKEYFKSKKSLKNLSDEFGISSSEFHNLIVLNYSQIDSPKTDPLVRLCRGIIVEKDTWDIIHYPFYRFYNFEEVIEERQKFNWNKAVATQKIDGSLWGVFNYNDEWYISSRSQIGGFNKTNFCEVTFGDIFDKAIHPFSRDEFFATLNKNLDYTFELVSPYNQIVTPYSECDIYLIGLRDKSNNFHEISLIDAEKIEHIAALIKYEIIKVPKIIPLVDENGKFRGFEEMKALAEAGEKTDEGFVVVDWSSYDNEAEAFPRVKVKNSSYVALHHLRGTVENNSLNYDNILSIIFKNEQDEILATFPQFKSYFDDVEFKWNSWLNKLKTEIEKNKEFFDIPFEKRKDSDIKKNFALNINKDFSAFMFYMFNKNCNNVYDMFKEMSDGKDSFWKNLWNNYVSKE